MAEAGSSRTEVIILLLFLTSLLDPCHTLSLPVTGCKNLCSINQTTEEDKGKCLQSCVETLEKLEDETPEDKVDLAPGTFKSLEAGSDFTRVTRSWDSSQFVGPYQRRPHYLRIGRSGVNPSEDLKRARPSHYVRIGRGFTDDISADGEELNEDRRGRSSHYLRIGRSSDEQETIVEELNKRAKPSHYLRIGRSGEEQETPAMGDELNKRAKPSHYLRIGRSDSADDDLIEEQEKRARTAHYLRIGRGGLDDLTEEEKRAKQAHYLRIGRGGLEDLTEEEKRAKPAHYLRIGRGGLDDLTEEEKRSKPAHYLRIGRAGLDDLNEEEKRAKPAHYLRIGRDSTDGLESPESYTGESLNPMSPYLAVYPLVKRDAKRPYRQSHYLRIGR